MGRFLDFANKIITTKQLSGETAMLLKAVALYRDDHHGESLPDGNERYRLLRSYITKVEINNEIANLENDFKVKV
jgi:hypothetical protein